MNRTHSPMTAGGDTKRLRFWLKVYAVPTVVAVLGICAPFSLMSLPNRQLFVPLVLATSMWGIVFFIGLALCLVVKIAPPRMGRKGVAQYLSAVFLVVGLAMIERQPLWFIILLTLVGYGFLVLGLYWEPILLGQWRWPVRKTNRPRG